MAKPTLPSIGTRVYVTGTRHHGFKGYVAPKPVGWSERSIAVHLDEWPDDTFKFYLHNLMRVLRNGKVRHFPS